jgi:ATP-dependent DNA helicase RecG
LKFPEEASGFLCRLSYAEQKFVSEVGEKVGERVTENQLKILECIQQNPYISTREMAIFVGISSRKIEENLKKIKEYRILERVE